MLSEQERTGHTGFGCAWGPWERPLPEGTAHPLPCDVDCCYSSWGWCTPQVALASREVRNADWYVKATKFFTVTHSLPGAPQWRCRDSVLKSMNTLSPTSGGWKSETKLLAGLDPSKVPQSCPRPLPPQLRACWQLGVLAAVSPSLSSSSHGVFPTCRCLSGSKFPL